MTIVEKIIRRSYSKTQHKTSMEIELYNDDYTPVTGAQIALLMAKCMNGPLHCQYVSARMQYDESLDWEDLSEGELAITIANIDGGATNLPEKNRFEFRY